MANDHLKFNFVPPHIGYANDQTQVENSLIAWMNHAFLNIGGFVNINSGDVGHFGGYPGNLRPVKVPGYSNYQVYQGFRKDWVWETGTLDYSFGSPKECSGIYVNGSFYPTSTTTGTYAHRVEFPAGRVVFTNGAIPSGSVVSTNYAYRVVQVIKGDLEDFKTFEFYSNRDDSTSFLYFGSGVQDVPWDARIQLPCVAIVAGKTENEPYQLGTLQQTVYQNVSFLVFSENKFWRDQLLHILNNQSDKRIFLVDFNTLAASGQTPLNIYGGRNPNGITYPAMVNFPGDGHARGLLGFINTRISTQQKIHKNLYYGVVTADMEFLMR